MTRIWERGLRKAQLPIAYSEGFSPHPKVSFTDALTLGYASTGEYAELTFMGPFDLSPAVASLNAALPPGLDVLHMTPVADGAPKLSKWLRCSLWELTYADCAPAAVEARQRAVERILRDTTVIVGRQGKEDITDVDLRPSIAHLRATPDHVRVVLHHTQPPMRPQEVHQALADGSASHQLSPPALVTRIAQGEPNDDGLIEALSGEHISIVPTAKPMSQKATT